MLGIVWFLDWYVCLLTFYFFLADFMSSPISNSEIFLLVYLFVPIYIYIFGSKLVQEFGSSFFRALSSQKHAALIYSRKLLAAHQFKTGLLPRVWRITQLNYWRPHHRLYLSNYNIYEAALIPDTLNLESNQQINYKAWSLGSVGLGLLLAFCILC